MKYIFDTNAVIYYLEGKIVLDINDDDFIGISVISEIELFGKDISEEENRIIMSFLDQMKRIGLDDEIKNKTIELRKRKKLKIPDAIIAATAIVNEATLLTADKELLKKLDDENVKNPLELQNTK